MVLAAILWVCALPQTDDLGKFSAALKANGERQTLSVTPFDSTSRDSIVRAASPSAPEPKVTSEPAVLRSSAEPVQPVRATAGRPGESPRQRKTWYGLMVSQNPWIRKFWWLPQTAGASVSLLAGRHNLGVVP